MESEDFMGELISIIVPVYNVDRYLERCVASILKQTYKDYEIILIDDGSNDNSPKICDEYSKIYTNIKTFHIKNSGLSFARNYGVSKAHGEFITCIDSDDCVTEDYLSLLYFSMKNNNCTMAVVQQLRFTDLNEVHINKKYKIYVYSGEKALENMLYQKMMDSSACGLLLPINMMKSNPYPEGKLHEDDLTTYKYYASANKVAVVGKICYLYYQRSGSIVHQEFGTAALDELDAVDFLVSECQKQWPSIVKAAQSKQFSDYCQVFLQYPEIKKIDYNTYKRIVTYLNNSKYRMIFDKKARKKNRIAAFLLIFGTHFFSFAAKFK